MKQKLPNIVFIVLDTLGAKHMSLYGYHRQTTPNMDRIAEECTVYSRCFAPACWTLPSHASMFTGLYPSQHGAHDANYLLDENVQHLASVLKMSGYRTMGISSNGLVSPASTLCRDFDYFVDFGEPEFKIFLNAFQERIGIVRDSGELQARLNKSMSNREQLKILVKYIMETKKIGEAINKSVRAAKIRINNLFPSKSVVMHSSYYTKRTVNLFRNMIDQYSNNNEQPFFIFMNILETHEIYRPPLRWRKYSKWRDEQSMSMLKFYHLKEDSRIRGLLNKYNNLYDDEILYLDNMVNDIWNILNKSPFADNTVFIITSDHGEHLGEKGLYQHRLSLYNELIWVPLMINFPNGITKTGIEDRLVSLNDLYATIIDLVHSPLPAPETSSSLLSNSKREFVISQYVYPEIYPEFKARYESCKLDGISFSPPIMAVMTDSGMKLLERRDESLEVYDLRKDMAESHDLVPDLSAEALANFRNLIEFLKQDTGYSEAVEAAIVSKETALDY